MSMTDADPKIALILEAAWMAFSSYGFRKTSMDDIARGAGMSRPALYLHFKNKEAIFRSLVNKYYAHTEADILSALDSSAPLEKKLHRAFSAHGGETMEAMMSSAHGMELFETSMSVAGDNIEEGEARLRAIYADWLKRAEAGEEVVLMGKPEDLGRLFCASLKGIKHTAESFAEYRQGVTDLASLNARALRP